MILRKTGIRLRCLPVFILLLLSPVLLPAATLFDGRFLGRSRISLAFDALDAEDADGASS